MSDRFMNTAVVIEPDWLAIANFKSYSLRTPQQFDIGRLVV